MGDKRFCIVRCEKISTNGDVAAAANHAFRVNDTPNADPARQHLNVTTGATSTAEVMACLHSRHVFADANRRRIYGRKTQINAVPAVEYLLSASPDWMGKQTPERIEEFFARCRRYLDARHGPENVLSTTVHYDEGSPHMSAIVVPMSPEGTLDAARFTSKPAYRALQTDFALKVGKDFGLERGIQDSKVKHKKVGQHYTDVNRPTPELTTEIPDVPPQTMKERAMAAAGMATDYDKAVEAAATARKQRAKEAAERLRILTAKANQADSDREKLANREAQLRRASFAREIPLVDVMTQLGATQNSRDKRNWDTAAGRISIGNEDQGLSTKFHNQDLNTGGGGAIDLVMHVDGVDYKTALRWLLDTFGSPMLEGQLVANAKRQVAEIEATPRPPYEPPVPSPERWPKVRAYLVEIRRLASRLVDVLHDAGRIYADSRANAVFELTSTDGDAVGVELRGTGSSAFKGVRGKKGVFNVAAVGDDRRVAFVESSIEALSLRELGFPGRIIGFAGTSPDLQLIYASGLIKGGFEVFAAFNADAAGDRMGAGLTATTPGVKRLRPSSSKDWNAELIARTSQEAAGTPPAKRSEQVDERDGSEGHERPGS